MEAKKTKKADVDRKRAIYFQIGLVMSLLLVIIAFEWRQSDPQTMELHSNLMLEEEEEIIDVTRQVDEPPPPPPPPELEIVDDEIELEPDRPQIEDVEIRPDEPIEMPVRREREVVQEEEIFAVVEKMPEPRGGIQELYRWIGRNVRYPQMEREMGVQGQVIVTFVVETDGSITNVRVLRSISKGLDDEAVRLVKSMPSWTPGEQRGRPVRVQFNLPIRFQLQ